jgi:hypothetical protein
MVEEGANMGKLYAIDIVAWSEQQAALLRSGRLAEIDVLNIAEEIEDVGKSEKRELRSRFSVLLAHLLKWQAQPQRRISHSWQATIRYQREAIELLFDETPSLRRMLEDEPWLALVWKDALVIATKETRLRDFPKSPVWNTQQILDPDFLPD